MEELQRHWKVVDNHFVLTSLTTGVEVKIPLDPMVGTTYTTEGLLSVVSQSFGVGNVREWALHNIPSRYKLFLEEFGMTCSNAAKVIRHMRYDSVKPYREWANKFAYQRSNRSYSSDQLQKIKAMLPILEQAKKDGNMHITPFIYSLEADPSKLKEFFGKALWKELCKNSFTRNRKICQIAPFGTVGQPVFRSSFPFLSSDYCEGNQYVADKLEHLRRSIKNLNKFQSKFLLNHRSNFLRFSSRYATAYPHTIDYLVNHQRSIKTIEELSSLYQTLLDTFDMSQGLRNDGVDHRKPNLDMSPGEMKILHDELVCVYNEHRNKIKAAQNANVIEKFIQRVSSYNNSVKIVERGEFTATMITTPEDLLNEGRTMHHCVASYNNRIADGQYLVYHITKNGEDYSTLGIVVDYTEIDGSQEKIFSRDQHYCKCNQPIPSEDMKSISALENTILTALKKEQYECA